MAISAIPRSDLVGSSSGNDPYGYGDSVRQVIEASTRLTQLLDVTPGSIRVDVHGEDVTVHAGHNCPSTDLAERALQQRINEGTTDTPVTVHVIRDP